MTLTATYNGLTIGAGTSFPFAKDSPIEGLFDLPDIRTHDSARSNDHGDYTGRDLISSREITLHLVPQWTSATDRRTLIQQLNNAFLPSDSALPLTLFDEFYVNAKVRRRAHPGWYPVARDSFIELYCDDPRIYEYSQQSATANLPTTAGGLTFPATAPFVFGAASVGGSITAVNSGNFPTRAVATIHGPLSDPRLSNGSSTLSMTITLGASDVLEVDFDNHAITLNGTASRRSSLNAGSVWWELEPGTNTVVFNAGTYDVAAFVQLVWRSAWV